MSSRDTIPFMNANFKLFYATKFGVYFWYNTKLLLSLRSILLCPEITEYKMNCLDFLEAILGSFW